MILTSLTFAQWPAKVFAPYVDVMLWPTFSLKNMHQQSGQKYYTLAFIVAKGPNDCTPAWGGITDLSKNFYKGEIDYIRRVGGDVIVSFGGANGTELALACKDENMLLQKYQAVIDMYKLTWVDFDIEGAAVADKPSIDRRSRVIKRLQDANPGLKIAFCLPVLPSGLTHDGIYVVESAQKNGVRIDVVNVMAMDYGDWAAPNPDGQMGKYAIDAGQNTRSQLQSRGINAEIGVTPMIGQNDVLSERFYLSDAQKLNTWAKSSGWVTLLSMWSANRDNGGCPNQKYADPKCSGLSQTDFAFSKIFQGFDSGMPTPIEKKDRESENIIGQFELLQNFPNPFNPVTTIRYRLARKNLVTLKVYNALGEEVAALVKGVQASGLHQVRFDAGELGSGIYLYRLEINNIAKVKRMMLVK